MMTYLVCGTRKKSNTEKVKEVLNFTYHQIHTTSNTENTTTPLMRIIHGNCPDSADIVADEWARNKERVIVEKFPAKQGQHLQRNLQMLDQADIVIAFWDGYSYGTAFVIAHATQKGMPVRIEKV